MGLTKEIADLAVSYQYCDLPQDVRNIACLAMLDNIGCAIRGASEPLTKILCEELVGQTIQGSRLVSGEVLAGTPNNHSMIYAASAHAIDFDDTLPPAMGAHAGSAVIGSLMALLPHQRVDGQELIAAIVTGYETAARVAGLLELDHYKNGFHATATIGVFGAAAAAGRLMKFDTEQMQQALGMAATQAAGLKCVFGTMTKPYNAAHSASSGLMSARLISRGFTAPEDALEAPKGYLDMFLGKPEDERQIAPKHEYLIRRNAFKFHAACHATHTMIEAIRLIQSQNQIDLDLIESVTVKTAELGIKTASIGEPTTGLECKFSYSYVAAATLYGADTSAEQTYSMEMANKPAVSDLRKKISVEPGIDDPLKSEVIIKLATGEEYSQHTNLYELMNDTTLVQAKLEKKFQTNTTPYVGEERSIELMNAIVNLGDQENVIAALAA